MSAGLPVIATEAVGAAAGGLVIHEQTGLVVPERDAAALAAAIDKLLAAEH
jgi:glycosyltransferase involved in cell wall biosynthesis